MSEEKFCAVDTLIERMKTHPEEFFEGDFGPDKKRGRWSFMYKDYFKDSLTESEKGRIHEQLRKVRRLEFDAMVVKELMKEEQKPEAENTLTVSTGTYTAPVKGEGQKVSW